MLPGEQQCPGLGHCTELLHPLEFLCWILCLGQHRHLREETQLPGMCRTREICESQVCLWLLCCVFSTASHLLEHLFISTDAISFSVLCTHTLIMISGTLIRPSHKALMATEPCRSPIPFSLRGCSSQEWFGWRAHPCSREVTMLLYCSKVWKCFSNTGKQQTLSCAQYRLG